MTTKIPDNPPPAPSNLSMGTKLWSMLSSSSWLLAVLLGLLLSLGSDVLIGWWGSGIGTSVQAWLQIIAISGVLVLLLDRLWGLRTGRWFLGLVFLTGLLNAYISVALTGSAQATGSYQQALQGWREAMLMLKIAGPQFFGGLLFFALLARLMELASLLWLPLPQQLPHLESSQRFDLPDALTQDTLKSQLQAHVGEPTQRDQGTIWVEQGRSAALGELWLLLGGLVALGSIAWFALSPQSISWTQLLLGAAPWIAIGALLQAGAPFLTICIRTTGPSSDGSHDGGTSTLWVYSSRVDHQDALAPLLAAFAAHKAPQATPAADDTIQDEG